MPYLQLVRSSSKMISLQIALCVQIAFTYVDVTVAFPSIPTQVPSKVSSSSLSATSSYDITVTNKSSPINPIWRLGSLRAGSSIGVGEVDRSIFGRYSRFVDEKPLLAKSMTAGIVTTMANIFSQALIINGPISLRRVIMYMLTGVCFIGPYLHIWYGYLDRVLAMPKQKNTTRTLAKVLADQTVGLCIFFPLYYTFLEIAESLLLGRVPMIFGALEKCRTDILGIAIVNWRIWPLTNAINFGIIPLQFRVLVNQIVSFFWFAYLSTRV